MPKVSEERLTQLFKSEGKTPITPTELIDLCTDLHEAKKEIKTLSQSLEQYEKAWSRWHQLAEKLSALALSLAEKNEPGAKEYVEEIANLAQTELDKLRKKNP